MKSVSRGAEEACLSQSAASMALKELEEGLQITLFHRNGKQLAINENGRRIQPLVSSLLSMARDLEQIGSEHETWGTLRVATSTTVGNAMLGDVCRIFCERHPSARLELQVVNSTDVVQAVETMTHDIGLIETPCNRKGLKAEVLTSDQLAVFGPPDHPLAKMQHVAIKDLLAQRWCLGDLKSFARSTLTLKLGESGLDIAMVCNSVDALKNAVAAGVGLGCLSERLIEAEVARGSLVKLSLDPSLRMERHISMVMPTHLYKGKLVESFAEIVRDNFSELASVDGEIAVPMNQ